MHRCFYCGKETKSVERLDYSPVHGLVHYDCYLKDIKTKVNPSVAENVVASAKLLDALSRIVGPENVKASYSDRAYYLRDHSTDFVDLERGYAPDVVVLPKTEKEVSEIVKLAAEEKIAVTPRGAGTGFVGGAVAVEGGILIDLMRMNRVLEIDDVNQRITAEPGVTVQAMEDRLREKGLTLGFDSGSGPVASVGGAVSTDQLGKDGWYSNVGSARDLVLCLRVVLADGTVVSTGRKLERPTSSVNVAHLFVGAEGSLGIVTQATLKVFPVPEATDLRVVVFDTFHQAAKTTMEMIRLGICPSIHHTAEIVRMDQPTVASEANSFGMLLLGFAGLREVVAAQMERSLAVCRANGGQDAGKQAVRDFWERHHEAFPVNLPNNRVYGMEGVALPLDKILPVYDQFCSIVRKHGMQLYGTAFGTRPTKLTVIYLFDGTDDGLKAKSAATEEMLKVSAGVGGTISGAHGIGFIKRKYFPLEYDENLILLLRAQKKALDPHGIMNPGKGVYE